MSGAPAQPGRGWLFFLTGDADAQRALRTAAAQHLNAERHRAGQHLPLSLLRPARAALRPPAHSSRSRLVSLSGCNTLAALRTFLSVTRTVAAGVLLHVLPDM